MESTSSFIEALRTANAQFVAEGDPGKAMTTFLGSKHRNTARAHRQVHLKVRELYIRQHASLFGLRVIRYINWSALLAWIIANRVLILRIVLTVLPLIL